MALAVDAHQQRLVVEHLLEVRHQPLAVDRVAGEAAADVVVHPAGGHRVERVVTTISGDSCPASAGAGGRQQQVEDHRRRELRRRAEPAPLPVDAVGQPLPRSPSTRASARAAVGGLEPRRGARWPGAAARRSASSSSRRLRHASSTASSSCRNCRLREVRAAVERLARRGEERPSSASRRARSSPAPRPCRWRRRRAAPRGRP